MLLNNEVVFCFTINCLGGLSDMGNSSMGVNQMIVYISTFVGSIVGLALAPNFVGYCVAAANDANITGTIAAIFYNPILPILYGTLCIAGLAAAIYKMFRR